MKTHALRIVWQGLWASSDVPENDKKQQDHSSLKVLIKSLQQRQDQLTEHLSQLNLSNASQLQLQRELRAVHRLLARADRRLRDS